MATQQQDWKKLFHKQGITVYKRHVPGSEFYEFKGTINIRASLASFGALLLDAPNMANWMHKTEEVRVIEQFSENDRIAYMRFDFSPIGKRELVVRNTVTQDPDDFSVTYSMDHQKGHEEHSRSKWAPIEGITGRVKATPQADGSIEITYQCHVEPSIKLLELWGASAVTNKLLSDTPYHTLRQAKQRIVQPHYRDADLDFIVEPEAVTA